MSKKTTKKLEEVARTEIESRLAEDAEKINEMKEVSTAFMAKAAELGLDPVTVLVQLVIMEKFFERVLKDRMKKRAEDGEFSNEDLRAMMNAAREIGQAYLKQNKNSGPEKATEQKPTPVDEDNAQGPYAYAPPKWRPNYIC